VKIIVRIHILNLMLLACCALTYAQQASEEQKKKPVIELFETVTVYADFEKPESPTTIAEVTAEPGSHSTYYNHVDAANYTAMVSSKVKLGDYFLANAKLTQKIKGGLALYFAIDNIGNKQYQTLYLYPSADRTYRGGLRFDI
jgi:outer membrane receptor protein involved in Fe transport